MKGALIAGSLAALVDVAVNVVSNNLNNPLAWVIFFVVVCVSATVGHLVEKKAIKKSNITNVIGVENKIEQEIGNKGNNTSQKANVIGKKNKVKQTVK